VANVRAGRRAWKEPSGIATGPPSTALAVREAIEARFAPALPVSVIALLLVRARPPAGV